ncbi:MAG: 3' terminal RNA ribose 2'-O-methyltransferase Hen1 [Myxococcota bacterium]|jgi:3' terminal RNA ribose 2'-O-methyltransferase Hen1
MLLTITTTHQPASDLGYLLAKHPDRCQAFSLPSGTAHVFYPQVSAERCTAALLLEIDPVALVRSRDGLSLDTYVNDRPYAASSLLCVALSRVLGSAMSGTSRERPELAATAIPLIVHLPVLPCRGGVGVLTALFEPLGYTISAQRLSLPGDLGESRLYDVTLSTTATLSALLRHLSVLIPVLDDDKHYWVGSDEVDKLLIRGEGWLERHPERKLITDRYLKHQGRLVRAAMADVEAEAEATAETGEAPTLKRPSLNDLRDAAVIAQIEEAGAKTVADVGCGEGRLLRKLSKRHHLTRLLGADVSSTALERARKRLPDRVELIQSSLLYRDRRLAGLDCMTLVEVIEHVEPDRLATLARAVFGHAGPSTVILTTPNRAYNVLYPTLAAGKFRHPDHRFEWDRAELSAWCDGVTAQYPYTATILPVGDEDPTHGPPTFLVLLRRQS